MTKIAPDELNPIKVLVIQVLPMKAGAFQPFSSHSQVRHVGSSRRIIPSYLYLKTLRRVCIVFTYNQGKAESVEKN